MDVKLGDSLKEKKRKLEATEMVAIRRAMIISRKDKFRDEAITQPVVIEGTIINAIAQKQLICLQWFGVDYL